MSVAKAATESEIVENSLPIVKKIATSYFDGLTTKTEGVITHIFEKIITEAIAYIEATVDKKKEAYKQKIEVLEREFIAKQQGVFNERIESVRLRTFISVIMSLLVPNWIEKLNTMKDSDIDKFIDDSMILNVLNGKMTSAPSYITMKYFRENSLSNSKYDEAIKLILQRYIVVPENSPQEIFDHLRRTIDLELQLSNLEIPATETPIKIVNEVSPIFKAKVADLTNQHKKMRDAAKAELAAIEKTKASLKATLNEKTEKLKKLESEYNSKKKIMDIFLSRNAVSEEFLTSIMN